MHRLILKGHSDPKVLDVLSKIRTTIFRILPMTLLRNLLRIE